MYSSHHAALSVLTGVALLPFVSTGLGAVGVVAYAVVLGVGVDFDHFLVARYNAGDWRALRACLADPRLAFVSQEEIFAPEEVGVLQRLLTHVVLAGVVREDVDHGVAFDERGDDRALRPAVDQRDRRAVAALVVDLDAVDGDLCADIGVVGHMPALVEFV